MFVLLPTTQGLVIFYGGSGVFNLTSGAKASYIASYDTGYDRWDSLGTSSDALDGPVFTLGATDSVLFVGGKFTSAGGVDRLGVAKWNVFQKQWGGLQGGVDNPRLGSASNAVFSSPCLDLTLIGGGFTKVGGSESGGSLNGAKTANFIGRVSFSPYITFLFSEKNPGIF